ncbi:MAG: DDE-type integrase/transposase/recombinase [Chloroflexi bacterium]|nr:DDE-type integrase/transposase/recombinase [Chloroflexota bacterium]
MADLTSGRIWSGLADVAFSSASDAHSRSLVGWHIACSLHTDLVRTAWEPALWVCQGPFDRLVHHSDRGVPYLSIRSTERLAEAGIATSVGSRGDSYGNALAESVLWMVHGGGGLSPRPLARQGGPGVRDPGVGGLVHPPAALGCHRLPAACGVRSAGLYSTHPGGSRDPIDEPSITPGAVHPHALAGGGNWGLVSPVPFQPV